MLPDTKIRCPATGFARTCREIISECDCPKFVSVKGRNPQTGAVVDSWGCVDSFLPLLLLENAQASHQTGASVDKLRSELADAAEATEQTRRAAVVALAPAISNMIANTRDRSG